ncbi:MAG: GxxExxY protein [Chitinophagaceae bacterium]
MKENQLTEAIIGCAIKVHKALGPGLLESAYKECLAHALYNVGFHVEIEKTLPLSFEGIVLQHGYRIDILVEHKIVVEIKSVEAINEVHIAQVLTYLKLGQFRVGLLINFNVALLKIGIRRLVNNFSEDTSHSS